MDISLFKLLSKSGRYCRRGFLTLVILLIAPLAMAASNGAIVYQGRIARPDGSSLNSGLITFTLSIYSPSPSRCLLYSETQVVNMNGSSGMFSLPLGAGTRTDSGLHPFSKIFVNGSTLSGLSCASGTSYTAGATDDRDLVVSFNDAGTVVNLSSMAIKSIPFALQAHEIDGWGLNNLVKVSALGSSTTFTPTEMANVKSVGAAACATNEILKWNGSAWMCSADATGGAPGDAGYTGSKGLVAFDTDAATSGITVSSGIAKLSNTGVTAATYGTASKVPAIAVNAQGRITTATEIPISIPSTQITVSGASSGDVLKWNGSAWLPAADNTGTSPGDATYAAKGLVQADTNASTSGLNLSSGVISVNTGTGANQIVKLDGSSKLPAVDGSQLTNLSAAQITAGTLPVSKGGTGSATALTNNKVMVSSGGAIVEGNGFGSTKAANTFVTRDASGNFAAGTGTFDSLKINGATSGTLTLTVPTSFTSFSLNLPSADGSSGQFLMTDGSGNLTWGTSAAPGDASYAAKGIFKADTDAATSGLSFSASGVLKVNAGTGASQIVQLDGSSRLPAVDGSQLTNLSAAQITAGTLPISRGGTGASTKTAAFDALSPNSTKGDITVFNGTNNVSLPVGSNGQVLTADSAQATGVKWASASSGTVTSVTAGSGLNGGTITSVGTLSVNVGTGANQIVQLDASSKLPAVDGSQLTNLSFSQISSGTLPVSKGGTGASTFSANQLVGTDGTGTVLQSVTCSQNQVVSFDASGNYGCYNLSSIAGGTYFANGGNSFGSAANLGTNDAYALSFKTNNSNRMIIDTSGNVGIGTMSPGAKLHVSGGDIAVDNTKLYSMYDNSGSNTLGGYLNMTSINNIQLANLSATGQNQYIVLNNSGSHVFYTGTGSGTERLRIDNNGRVGIGVSSPQSPLDVKGALRLTGATSGYTGFQPAANAGSTIWTLPTVDGGSGQFLMTDGAGKLSWGTSAAPGDASYSTKGIFKADTDAATSGLAFSSSGVLKVNAGTGANQIVQLDGSSRLPAVDGSQLTNLSAAQITAGTLPISRGGTGASTKTAAFDALSPNSTKGDLTVFNGTNNVSLPVGSNGQVLTADSAQATGVKWASASSGTVTSVTGGTGLNGGTITSVGTLSVNVGTGANQIVQLDASSKLPTVDGSQLTNLSATQISSGTLPVNRGGTGASSFSANQLVGTDGTGTALQSVTCSQNQVLSFDASGNYGCYSLGSIAGGTYFANGGNTFGANATLGTNDTFTLGFKTNNSTRMSIDTAGNVGIGTSSPSYHFDVRDAYSGTSGSYFSAVQSLNFNPSTASTSSVNGIESDAVYTSTVNSPSGGVYALRGAAQNSSSGSVGTLSSLLTDTANWGSGSVTDAYGVEAIVRNSSTGSISNARGVYAQISKTAGSITNGYGVYIDTVQATNKWSLYVSDPSAPSYFAGNVGIGTSSPGSLLTVSKAQNNQTEILIENTNSGTSAKAIVTAKNDSGNFMTLGMTSSAYSTGTSLTSDLGYIYSAGTGGLSLVAADASAPLRFVTGGNTLSNERMRIDSSGKVGIGTNNPQSPLDVKGAIRLTGATSGYTGFQPAANAGSTIWTLPIVDGSTGQFLMTDGAGNLSWATSAAPGNASYAAKGIVQFNTDAATSGISLSSGVATVNFGTGANQIVQLDGSSRLPAVDGSQLTNLSAAQITAGTLPISRGGTGASTKTAAFDALSPNSTKGDITVFNGTNNVSLPVGSNGQVLTADSAQATGVKWASASSGTVTSVTAGTGLNGGTITSVGTLSVNVGTGANQIVQLDGSSKLPAIDGSQITNLSFSQISSGTLPVSKGGTGASSLNANQLVGTNGTGTVLQSVTCAQNKVLSFDASGNYGCYDLSSIAGGTYFANGGNSFAANATLGTNDNYTLGFKTNNTTRLTIDSSGNVGVGKSSPGALLHVASSGQTSAFFDGPIGVNVTSLGNGNIPLVARSSNAQYSYFASGSTASASQIKLQQGGGAYADDSAVSALISADATTRDLDLSTTVGHILLMPTSGKNVGIGATSPSYPLQVNGVIASYDPSTSLAMTVGGAGADYINLAGNQDASILLGLNLGFKDATTNRNTLVTPKTNAQTSGAGMVIAGNGSTVGGLSGNDIGFFTKTAGSATAGATYSQSPSLVVKAGGNVGIGTTSPQSKLDVNGSVRVGTDATACSTTIQGAIRMNGATLEFCNGTAWASAGSGAFLPLSGGTLSGALTIAATTAGGALETLNAGAGSSKFNSWQLSGTEYAYLSPGQFFLRDQNAPSGSSTSITIRGNSITPNFYGYAENGARVGVLGYNNSSAGTGAGVVAVADANPALIAESKGTTNDSMIVTSRSVTSGRLAFFEQLTSAFTGDALQMNMAAGSGSFSGNFINLQKNGSTKFIVKSDGSVGIGTSSPSSLLSVSASSSSGTISNTAYEGSNQYSAPTLLLRRAGGTEGAPAGLPSNFTMGSIAFQGYESGVSSWLDGASISAVPEANGWNIMPTSLEFRTRDTADTSPYLRMKIDSAGKVGIGSGNPQAALDIATTGAYSAMIVPRDTSGNRPSTAVNGMIRYNTTNSKFEAYENGGWTNMIGAGSTGYVNGGNSFGANATLGTNDNYTLSLKTNNTNRMTIDTSGNVGIGTTAPGSLLTVNTSTNDEGIALQGAGGGISPAFKFNSSAGTTYARIGIAGAAGMMVSDSALNDLVLRTENKNLHLGTNSGNASALTVQATTGNVGIGTTSPSYRLHVPWLSGDTAATAYFGSTNSSNNQKAILAESYNNNAIQATVTDPTGSYSAIYGINANGGNGVLGWSNSGIGVLGTSYSGMSGFFQANIASNVNPTLVTKQIGAGTGDLFQAQNSSGTALFKITSAGNVGIGTTSPSGPLEVQGGTAAASTNGKNIVLTAQNAGTGNMNGGHIVLTPGVKSGTGTNGAVSIGTTTVPSWMPANSLYAAGSIVSATDVNVGTGNYLSWGDSSTRIQGYTPSGFLAMTTNGTERLTILSSGNVGIGTTNPSYALQVSRASSSSAIQVYSGTNDANLWSSGYRGVLTLQSSAGGADAKIKTIMSDSGSLKFGKADDAWSTETTHMIILDSGNVGISNSSPSALLHVGSASVGAGSTVAKFQSATGTCSVTPNTGMSCASDERLKQNFKEVSGEEALEKLISLQAVTYEMKSEPGKKQTGFIAQKVQKVIPELVRQDEGTGLFEVFYTGFVPWITESMKALNAKIMGQERDIATVMAENAQLKKENEAIKAYLCGKDPTAPICK